MISLKELILERMSFTDLMNISEPKRIQRSKDVKPKSLGVKMIENQEAWTFSYRTKSPTIPCDVGPNQIEVPHSHRGLIKFYKEDIGPNDNAIDIDCMVDCNCPDYRNRFAFNNKRQDAGEIGQNTLNKCINRAPKINLGPGLCKHLLSLSSYLETVLKQDDTKQQNIFERIDRFAKSNPQFEVNYYD